MKPNDTPNDQVLADQRKDLELFRMEAGLQQIIGRLQRIETAVATLIEQRQVQDWYDTKAAAEILGKSAYSVREWCRLGRVRAEKRACGRGTAKEWMISHGELMRIKAEGLLPQRPPR